MFVVPPGAGVPGIVPVDETADPNNSSPSEHSRVETQPGKVDANLLPVVVPVNKNN